MKHKNWLIAVFALVAIAQLLVPYRMISHQADFALSGNEFKFKIRHNRTGYSIRGNFIWLQFEADKIKVADKNEWKNSQSVFVTFSTDTMGFAEIQAVSTEKPVNSDYWVKARAFLHHRDSTRNDSLRISRMAGLKDSSYLQLTYPFHEFYISESDKEVVRKNFLGKMNNLESVITLLVNVRENQFLIGDLKVDSVGFSEYVKGIAR